MLNLIPFTPEPPHDIMMRFPFSRTHVIALLLLTAFFAAGCISRPTENASPGELFILGQQDLRSERFEAAREAFKRLLREYPGSKHRREALLNLADSYFKEEQYIEAKEQYHEYVKRYRFSPHTSRAYYHLGMSDYNQIFSFDRDQSLAQAALKSFKELVKHSPKSKFAGQAKEKIREIREILGKSSLFIARFYLRRGQRVSAIPRFREIIKEYRDLPKIRAEAIFYLGESFQLEESYQKAGKTYRTLIIEYPRSPFSQEAYDRLLELTKNN